MFKQFIYAVLLTSFIALTAQAKADVADPHSQVKSATEAMLQALKDNRQALIDDSSKIYDLVNEHIMPHFDFEKMSKLALGKNWRKASKAQREQFIEEFRLLLVRTYSTALLEYTDERIDFLPFNGDVKKKKVKVEMEIIQQGGPSIPMALSLYLNEQSEWKVYDVKIDGISLVTNYRSSFANEIRTEGMDKLIERLASRNEKVKA
jgi:phospholipid transport system substrate-binding protein